MERVRKFLEKINIKGVVREQEPMALHTSFRVGGPADLYVEPISIPECIETIRLAKECSLPWIVLGEGSNVLVADAGIEGVVISTLRISKITIEGTLLTAEAGTKVDSVVKASCKAGLRGLEFLSGMPGSIGGAVWMNARCYGSEISEALAQVVYLNELLEQKTLHVSHLPVKSSHNHDEYRKSTMEGVSQVEGFGYKKSPFQGKPWIILKASFHLTSEDPRILEEKTQEYRQDRERKGHYLAPSAGSVFKNDRSFGEPAGVILDRMGFKGFRIGDAEVSPLHANIIFNRGAARASDIRALVDRMQEAVLKVYGRPLEPEIIFLGRWES
ncbi:MAG: UDP-N-acetylmuramate dehydrogenase [Spirochaetes bacterium]|nr:UDP-N-acetylmuramate dehydrogenase [Spirochaetota bacterium]